MLPLINEAVSAKETKVALAAKRAIISTRCKVIGRELMWHCAVQNVVLISIPSVMDADLAPAGKHTLHAYLPATEPFDLWAGESRCIPCWCTTSY